MHHFVVSVSLLIYFQSSFKDIPPTKAAQQLLQNVTRNRVANKKKMIIVHRRKIMITFLTYNYLESEDRYIWPSVDEILDVKFMQFMR